MIPVVRRRASSIITDIVADSPGRWIIPDNVCHAVLAAVISGGGTPVLTDVEVHTWELDTRIVLQQVTDPEVKGLILVRTYGNLSVDYESFFQSIKKIRKDVVIIDDRCLCPPEFSMPQGLADVYLFSTGYSKFVDIGYGGYCFSKITINHRHRVFNPGEEKIFDTYFKGIVYAGEPVNLAELDRICSSAWIDDEPVDSKAYFDQVKSALPEALTVKSALNSIYQNGLHPEFIFSPAYNNWRFIVRLSNRDELLEKFAEHGLFASKHYFPLSRLMNQLTTETWDREFKNVLNLFNDFRYSADKAILTVELINKYGVRADT